MHLIRNKERSDTGCISKNLLHILLQQGLLRPHPVIHSKSSHLLTPEMSPEILKIIHIRDMDMDQAPVSSQPLQKTVLHPMHRKLGARMISLLVKDKCDIMPSDRMSFAASRRLAKG
jgi:hypothetical protein